MSARTQPQVAIVQHSIRRYRAPFFEALRSGLAGVGVHLRLIHSDEPARLDWRPHKAHIPWAEVHPGRRFYMKDKSLVWQPVLRATRDVDLVIVEQASHLLANYLLVARERLGGPPIALWGHGRNFLLPEGEGSISEAVKAAVSRRAHWWFAYNNRAADVVAGMGYPRSRITVVENATDTRRLARQVADITGEGLVAARRDLGAGGGNICAFVGTLGAVKRFDYLFAAAELIQKAVPDFELVLAGSGMEESMVAEWASQRPWAHYAGPLFGADVVPLLATARLLLVPAWAGLVVVDSFGAGVPLVASASMPHPPEIDYLADGVNGRLVEDRSAPACYAEAVVDLLCDEGARQKLVCGCVESRSRYSTEAMAQRFVAGVLDALR